MITALCGNLLECHPTHIEILIPGGIVYHVEIPLSSYETLQKTPQNAMVKTHMVIKETEHNLYGFATEKERTLFRLLIKHVSGIGPKTALNVLSGLSVEAFETALFQENSDALSKIKGIGKKTAERIIIELKDTVNTTTHCSPEKRNTTKSEAILTLIALGYKETEAQKIIHPMLDNLDTTQLVKSALIGLNKPNQ
jgi:Holliday junction DNA helicase RuvA